MAVATKQAETTLADMHAHLETVRPGLPYRFSDAADFGEGVWQGDLCLELVAEVPPDYEAVSRPKAADKQLVIGSTQGSRHCLDSLHGGNLHRPADWGKNLDSLVGPCLVLTEERTVLHPTHGAVTIPAGRTILCSYQRVWDMEQQAARRSLD